MNSLDYAIQMELDGQEYYLAQAQKNAHNELKRVFELLAKAEGEHWQLLVKRRDQEEVSSGSRDYSQLENIFQNLDDIIGEIKDVLQVDVYRFASEQEEKSILLYQELLDSSTDENDKELFSYLIEEEEKHRTLFEQLYHMVARPEEWIEAAEFGEREEY